MKTSDMIVKLRNIKPAMTVGELVNMIDYRKIDIDTTISVRLDTGSDWPMVIDAIKISGYDATATVGPMWTEIDGSPSSNIAESRMLTFIDALADVIGQCNATSQSKVMLQYTVRNVYASHSTKDTYITEWGTLRRAEWKKESPKGVDILMLYIG